MPIVKRFRHPSGRLQRDVWAGFSKVLKDSDKCLRGLTMLEKTLCRNLAEFRGVLASELLRRFWKVLFGRRNAGSMPCVMESWQLQKYQMPR